MPLRTATIRRCGFKLPRNNKYQCQKAGDRFQPVLKLWYCRLHDDHAQDRCQVLVQWAGKGAQCEHLGAFDQSIGKNLCEWHATRAKRHDRDIKQRNDSAQEDIAKEGNGQVAVFTDDPSSGESTTSSLSLSLASKDETREATCFTLPTLESHPPSPAAEFSEWPEQAASNNERFNKAGAFLDDTDSKSDVQYQNDPILDTMECFGALYHMLTFRDIAVKECSSPMVASCMDEDDKFRSADTSINAEEMHLTPSDQRELVAAVVEGGNSSDYSSRLYNDTDAANSRSFSSSPAILLDSSKAPRTRIDSLSPVSPVSPLFDFRLHTVDGRISTTTTSFHDDNQKRPLQSPTVVYGTATSGQSVHARIDFLNALRDRDASDSNRVVAVYAQCCVCLERHGEYNMRQIEPCKHRYRNLCLKKVTKMRSLRKFNCSSCREWMAQQQENMAKDGRS